MSTLETGYRSTLAAKLNATDITITVATAPTRTAGRMHIYRGSTHAWIKYTGLTGTTLTGVTFVSQTADPATSVTGVTFPAGTSIELVEMHDQMLDKQEGGTIPGATVFSNSLKVPVYADATARDAAITVPANGMIIYNTALGILQQYIAGAWASFASGTTVNADTTTAGKVEIATTAESIAGTATGGTGSTLNVSPSDIAKNIQSGTFVYGADVGGDDTYVVALTPTLSAYTTGQTLTMKVTTANTGACTVDFGPGVKSIKMPDGSNPASGSITGIVNLMYDGTNFVLQNQDGLVKNGTYSNVSASRSGGSGTTTGTSTGLLAKATLGTFVYNNSNANASAGLQYSSDDASFTTLITGGNTSGVNDFVSVYLNAGYSYRIEVTTVGAGPSASGTLRYFI